jgi:Mg2+-importing ATPase
MLITKGAVAEVLDVAATARLGGAVVPIDTVRPQILELFERLSSEGHRVLAVATRSLPGRRTVEVEDEIGVTLVGLLTFVDPPKPDAPGAIAHLARLGVSVRMITGDNRLAAGVVAASVGLESAGLLAGPEIERSSDDELRALVSGVTVFAEVQPRHKQRIVAALRDNGETVGFLGDGINDSPALHVADVGISVDSAVDVAKQAAAIVLLDKDLDVVADGIRLGRRTFANTMKYIRVTTSANFGNMLSMAAAAAFLPFLPLLPRQILLLNFLSDIPATTIAADEVDADQLDRPSPWDIRSIRTFMIVFGLISSAFDIVTFVVLRVGYDANADLFRSSWFVISTATELAVMLVLRTARPFWRSRPATPLLLASALIAAVVITLPYTPLAGALGLVAIPARVLVGLVVLVAGYVASNELAKGRTAAL